MSLAALNDKLANIPPSNAVEEKEGGGVPPPAEPKIVILTEEQYEKLMEKAEAYDKYKKEMEGTMRELKQMQTALTAQLKSTHERMETLESQNTTLKWAAGGAGVVATCSFGIIAAPIAIPIAAVLAGGAVKMGKDMLNILISQGSIKLA